MKSRTLLALLTLIPTIPLAAGTATVQMNAVKKASGGTLDALPDSVRFGVSFPGSAADDVTHLVTDPFSPVTDNQEWVAASYRGVVAGSGAIGETGTMLLQVPEAPTDASVSPIVAVIPRGGSWSNYNLTPASTLFDGVNGGATFDEGQLAVSMLINGVEHSGVIVATPTGSGNLQIGPFTLSATGSEYSFSAAELQQLENRYVGEVVRLDTGVDYETLLTTLTIGSISDYDLDGVPDIVDDSVEPWFGAHESYSNGWVISTKYGTMYPYNASSFVYHLQHGILFILPQDGYTFMWDNELGWLFSSLDYYPTIYQYSTGHWLYYNATEGNQRSFWNYTTGDWQNAPISG